MLIPCKILRSFPYTRDGYTQSQAVVDSVEDIPAVLVEGLEREGFLKPLRPAEGEAKEIHASPENKAIQASPENKRVKRGRKG